MNNLSKLLIFKIVATLSVWCIPLIFFPAELLQLCGLPAMNTYMFARMLGWAYFVLCIGYYFGLRDELDGRRNMGVIYVGLASNGGGCFYLLYFGFIGTFKDWGLGLQIIGWGSAITAGLITVGLIMFGCLDGKNSCPCGKKA